MSTDSRVWSSLHESPFDEQQSIQLSQTCGLLRRRSKAAGFYSLNSDFYKVGRVKGLFRFHYFKPAFNSFFDISNSFLKSFTLRKAAGKSGNLRHKISVLVLCNNCMNFHVLNIAQTSGLCKQRIKAALLRECGYM